MAPGALERGPRVVGALGAEVYVSAAHPPQLEAARPADLVELEIRFVARVAVVPAPDLRRGAGVAHERRDRAARATARDPVGAIRRPRHLASPVRGRRVVPLRVEPLHAQGDILVRAERAAGAGEMSVGEEEPEPGVREVLFGAGANPPPPPPPPPQARPPAPRP